ncbi:M23 family metallopeptidase [Mycobacterium sp. BMJ-28]
MARLVLWCVVVATTVFTGVTTTDAGVWIANLLTLVLFWILSWRFFAPSLTVAPSPMSALVAIGAIAVAFRGGWVDGAISDGFTDPRAWIALVLAVAAGAAALADPFTGIATPMTGELIFPMRDGRWRVVQGQGRIFNHHWPSPEQREAFDLVRISRTGRTRRGIRGRGNNEFYAFGTVIVAPCSGSVIRTHDGMPDDGQGASQPAGNHVVIDNGHEHVLLAHMRSGTVAVSTGDQVCAGEPIGAVGNSGNSSEPHLHLEASRDGRPLRLRFSDVGGRFGKGRVIAAPKRYRPGPL